MAVMASAGARMKWELFSKLESWHAFGYRRKEEHSLLFLTSK